jgi:UrcA family protein
LSIQISGLIEIERGTETNQTPNTARPWSCASAASSVTAPKPTTQPKEIAMNTFTRLASAAVLGLALNAAYGEEAPKTLTVQFADLDLSKDAGLARLFDRLKGAATRVCSGQSGGTTLRDHQQYAACVDFALSNAVARVDRPELTEYVVGRHSVEKKPATKVASRP